MLILISVYTVQCMKTLRPAWSFVRMNIFKGFYCVCLFCSGRKRKTGVLEFLVWTSPGLPGFWTVRKELWSGRRVPSTGLCVAEDVQPGRAQDLKVLQPARCLPPNHRPAAYGTALDLDTWQEQSLLPCKCCITGLLVDMQFSISTLTKHRKHTKTNANLHLLLHVYKEKARKGSAIQTELWILNCQKERYMFLLRVIQDRKLIIKCVI